MSKGVYFLLMQWQELRSHLRHLAEVDLKRIKEAFLLGEKAHAGQLRKSGEPYFTHPVAIAHLLADMDADADTVIAALLHDTVEDTNVTLPDIRSAFGATVANLIDGLTKLSREELPNKTTLDEQIETLRKMFTLMQQDVRIMVIKLVDRLHNMQTLSFLAKERQRAMAQETLDVYVKIADRLSMQDLRDELESLSLSSLDPQEHERLQELRLHNEQRSKAAIQMMTKELHAALPMTKPPTLVHEHKTWRELRTQLERGEAAVTGIPDIIITFVCPDIDSCYRTLGGLHQCWQRETLSFQDYINSPLLNGYRALHTTVILHNGTRVRCKIRTQDMHQYARKGVSKVCFDMEPKGLFDYLPWTQRISAVTQDTADRSAEFWESLQSDILGESIVIHAPTGDAVSIPKVSTALDGVFYVLNTLGLRTADIQVNGQSIPFFSPLHHGDSLTVRTANDRQVQHDWLEWVHTGLATAMIRTALGTGEIGERLQIGQRLLQYSLSDQSKGMIQELQEKGVAEKIAALGYQSMDDVYVAIADGHLDPAVVAEALFASGKSHGMHRLKWVLQYTVPQDDERVAQRIEVVRERYDEWITDVHVHQDGEAGTVTVTWRIVLSAAEQRLLLMALRHAGALDVRVSFLHTHIKSLIGTILLIAMWGIDPILSRMLVQDVIPPIDLTYLRFATMFLASTVAYGFHTAVASAKLKPLQPLQPALLLAGLASFVTALLTYQTLQLIPASLYILFVLAGQLCAMLLRDALRSTKQLSSLTPLALVGSAIACFLFFRPAPAAGILLAIGSSISFSAYTMISEHYQSRMINTRYPAYLFWLSIVGVLCCFMLLPFRAVSALPPQLLLIGIGFTFTFVFIPYVLYFEASRRLGRDVLDRLLPLTCLATIAGEFLLAPSLSLTFLAAVACTLLALQHLIRR